MRTLAIVNPRSGGTGDLSRVASAIRRHPAMRDPDVRITGGRDDARLFARAGARQGFARIFAAGGDGTLNEVVNGLMEAPEDARRKVVLGLIPLGTGNDFARSLDIPLDLEEALDRVESLVPRWTDVARVGTDEARYYLNVSAGGFSGEVDERVTAERKESWGPLAYLRGALDLLPDPEGYRVELTFGDGEARELDGLNVVVANGRTVAGGIPIAPQACLDDGLLEVVVVRQAPMGTLAGFGSRCLLGRHLDHELTLYRRAESLTVRSDPAMTFNLDGEPLAATPLRYGIEPRALQLLAGEDAPGFRTGSDDA